MKPIEFKEQKLIVAKDSKVYGPLPVWYKDIDPTGEIVICWSLTWRERLVVMLQGHFWQRMCTFHKPIAPQAFAVDKPVMEEASEIVEYFTKPDVDHLPFEESCKNCPACNKE